MKLFDSHAHLDDDRYDEDREEIIKNLQQNNIKKVIVAGYNLESSEKCSDLAKEYENIYATVGLSPNGIPQNEEKVWKHISEIELLVKDNKKIVGIGEIGLDYYWHKDNYDFQKSIFIKQIELANKLNLPIAIHSREAYKDTIEVLKNNPVIKKGVFHCCQLNQELIREALELGFYISLAGPVTFKNSKNANEIIEKIPLDKIVIETDSPYLTPEPNRGKRNEPKNVKYVAEKIAEVKKIDIENVAKITYENTKKLYNILT